MVSASSPARRPRAVSPVVLVATMLLAISSFQVAAIMIIPALPKIGGHLGATAGQISLEQSVFFAIGGLFAAALPVGDRIGRHRALAGVLVLGIVGSVLIASTSTLALFDIGRWLQATAVIALPLSYLILRDAVPADRYPIYFGWLNAFNAGITGIDGFVAGRVTDTVGYHDIFWISAALGVVALVCVLLVVPRSAPVAGRTDWPGIATLGAGVVAVSVGLAQAGTWGWTSARTLALLAGGGVLLAVFTAVERVSPHPLVQVSYLASRRVWGLALVVLVSMAGYMGATQLLMPFWAELPKAAGGFGYSATTYSLAILPGTFGAMCVAPVAGFVAKRSGWRPVLITAVAVTAASMTGLALSIHHPLPTFVLVALTTCAFAGTAMTAASGLGVLFSPERSPAFLPGIVSVMFSFGSSLGFAVGGSVLSRHTVSIPGAPPIPTPDSFRTTFELMAGFVIVAAVLTFVIPRTSETRRADTPAPAPKAVEA